MDIAQSALIPLSIVVMIVGLVLEFIPILPGTLIVWGIAINTAILDGFDRVTPAASIVMTLIMIFGVSSDFWLPMVGVRTSGLTCLAAVGSLVGGLVGTFVIPVPIVGSLIGAVIGAVAIEYVRLRETRKTIAVGKTVIQLFIVGYIIELVTSFAIFGIFLFSVASTGG